MRVRAEDIDYELARGGKSDETKGDKQDGSIIKTLLGDRVLLIFLICAFLFHFANAAMLPQLGEMLSKGGIRTAAPFMSACIIVTQFVIMCSADAIGRWANKHGRKPLLLLGFGVLPVRAFLYTVVHHRAGLVSVQLLDGVANAIFGVVSILVIADRTHGTGRFNLVAGALATAVGLGAALSTTFGGKLIQHGSYTISFLALGAVAALALLLLWSTLPETLMKESKPGYGQFAGEQCMNNTPTAHHLEPPVEQDSILKRMQNLTSVSMRESAARTIILSFARMQCSVETYPLSCLSFVRYLG